MGCVLLVVALFLAGGWRRSYLTKDVVWIYTNDQILHWLVSSRGCLKWITIQAVDHKIGGIIRNRWRSYPVPVPDSSDRLHDGNTQWYESTFGQGDSTAEMRAVRIVPYWSVILAITLLSAYLILWPGKRKAAKPTQNAL